MAKYGKRTTAARAAFAGKSLVSVEEAVALLKSNSKAKFDETIEIAMNLGVDPRHADQMVRERLIYQTVLEKLCESLCLLGAQKLKRLWLLALILLVQKI